MQDCDLKMQIIRSLTEVQLNSLPRDWVYKCVRKPSWALVLLNPVPADYIVWATWYVFMLVTGKGDFYPDETFTELEY